MSNKEKEKDRWRFYQVKKNDKHPNPSS